MSDDPISHAKLKDGTLFDLGWYLLWRPGNKSATLDGEFTADELEAIAQHMRDWKP